MGVIIITLRSKDEALIQDLLDRITARTPGDYLNIVYFREKNLPKTSGLIFKPLSKTKVNVPTVGEVEMDQAKREAVARARKEDFSEDYKIQEEFDKAQKVRAVQMRDTVLP